jgi:hypothetical protein
MPRTYRPGDRVLVAHRLVDASFLLDDTEPPNPEDDPMEVVDCKVLAVHEYGRYYDLLPVHYPQDGSAYLGDVKASEIMGPTPAHQLGRRFADYYADIEVREGNDQPWRFVAESYLGYGPELEEVILSPELEVTPGVPADFHRLVEFRRALDRAQGAATTEDRDEGWLSSQEDILSTYILDRFDPRHEEPQCWTTLDALERSPVVSDVFEAECELDCEAPRRIYDAVSLLRASGEGEDARLVICRCG